MTLAVVAPNRAALWPHRLGGAAHINTAPGLSPLAGLSLIGHLASIVNAAMDTALRVNLSCG